MHMVGVLSPEFMPLRNETHQVILHSLIILLYTVCHAAINAILNKNAENLKDCVLYITLFPAHEDAKMIIQAGIKEVVYFEDKYHDHNFTVIAKKLFQKAGVVFRRYSFKK